MRPFQVFRVWARRAPIGERMAASVAALLVVALVAWLVVPDDDPSADLLAGDAGTPDAPLSGSSDGTVDPGESGESGESGEPGETGQTSETGETTTQGGTDPSGQQGGGGGGGGADTTAPGQTPTTAARTCPPGTATGVTDKEIKIAISLTEIVGPVANNVFGIDSPEAQRNDYEAAIAAVNKEGGVACRKVVAQYFRVNPVDERQMRQTCSDVADAKVFALLDTGSLATRPAVLACFGQNKIPYFGAFYISAKAREQFYPYIYGFYYREQVYKNTAFALRERGFFDPARGFKKLGFIYRDCEKEALDAFRGWLREVGATNDRRVEYNVGCPAVLAVPTDIKQAVQTFKAQGVTHVTTANFTTDIREFQGEAGDQGFRPVYGLPDEALQQVATGSRAPDPEDMADAIAITLGRDGEQTTPGMAPTAGTQKCDALRKAAGLEPTWKKAANAGHACGQMWMLQAAANNAPELSAAGMQVGLQRTKSIDFSYPQGPNDFTGPRVTTGGQFWRAVQFKEECECWQVIQPEFRRGF